MTLHGFSIDTAENVELRERRLMIRRRGYSLIQSGNLLCRATRAKQIITAPSNTRPNVNDGASSCKENIIILIKDIPVHIFIFLL